MAVNKDGIISISEVDQIIKKNTTLVSLIGVKRNRISTTSSICWQ